MPLQLQWNQPAKSVIITGSFDNWSKSIHATQVRNGFQLQLDLKTSQKVVFKFLVDGLWATSPYYNIEEDNEGNKNNYVFYEATLAQQISESVHQYDNVAAGITGVPVSTANKAAEAETAEPKAEPKEAVPNELPAQKAAFQAQPAHSPVALISTVIEPQYAAVQEAGKGTETEPGLKVEALMIPALTKVSVAAPTATTVSKKSSTTLTDTHENAPVKQKGKNAFSKFFKKMFTKKQHANVA